MVGLKPSEDLMGCKVYFSRWLFPHMSGIRAGQASISLHVVSLMVILGYLTDEDLSTVGLFTQWLAVLKECSLRARRKL